MTYKIDDKGKPNEDIQTHKEQVHTKVRYQAEVLKEEMDAKAGTCIVI